MITKHQSTPSFGDDLRLRQAIVLLEQKRDQVTNQRLKYEELVNEWRAQENDYTNTIRILRNEFIIELIDDSSSAPPQQVPSTNAVSDTNLGEDLFGKPVGWVKPADVSWLDLIRNAIRNTDSLLTQRDITISLGMDEEFHEKHHKSISGSLANYRSTDQLVGILVYSRSTHGKAIPQYYTGLPEFFDDIVTKRLKPPYQQKFESKIRERGLYLSEEEATHI